MSDHLVTANTYRSWDDSYVGDSAVKSCDRRNTQGRFRGFLSRSDQSPRSRQHHFTWKDLRASEEPKLAAVVDLNGSRSRVFSHNVQAGHLKIFITIRQSSANDRSMVVNVENWQEARPQLTARFAGIRAEIKAMSRLPRGWDSYDAEAPSETATSIALRVLENLENLGLLPEWYVPTSDGSILLQFQCQQVTYKWEIESDGDIGVMVKSADNGPEYLDLQANQITRFFDERCYEIL